MSAGWWPKLRASETTFTRGSRAAARAIASRVRVLGAVVDEDQLVVDVAQRGGDPLGERVDGVLLLVHRSHHAQQLRLAVHGRQGTGAVSCCSHGRRGGGGTRAVRGRPAAGRGAADHPQPAEGARRQGDGPRLLGRGAEGGAVPLRRRRARLPQPRRPRAPPDRRSSRRSTSRRRRGRRDEDGQLQGRPPRAGDGGGDGRQAHGAPLHRRRGPEGRARRPARTCGRTASRRRSTCSARRRSPSPRPSATPTAAPTRWTRSRGAASSLARAAAARARLRRAAAAREPVREGVRADAAAAPRRARARQARRRRPPAAAAAARARARRAPAHRHGVDGLARRRAGADPRAAGRGRVPRRAVRRAGAPGLPARLAGDAGHDPRRGSTRRRARAAADDPAGQGRLLGPRARPGRAARLVRAGVRAQGRHRRELRAAHAPAARRAADASGSRSPRTTCARSPTRSPTTG